MTTFLIGQKQHMANTSPPNTHPQPMSALDQCEDYIPQDGLRVHTSKEKSKYRKIAPINTLDTFKYTYSPSSYAPRSVYNCIVDFFPPQKEII